MVRDPAALNAGNVLRLGNLELTAPRSPQRLARRRRRFRRLRRFIGISMAIGLLCGITFGALLLISPGVGNAPALARQLDSAHHAPYPGPAVPPRLAAALVASQDRGFYSETEPVRVAHEVMGQLIGSSRRSAPSFSQRLAAILYIHGRPGLAAAAEQALVSIKLDVSYSRAQIIQMFAAVTNFGRGYYGLAAASCGYFRRPPDRLSWAQAAVLAALSAAPSAANPIMHAARARAAEAVVLHRLAASGVLSRAAAARASRQPLRLAHRYPADPPC
jgi:membrane peptidoglycan carboxypeptidase